MSTPSPVVVIGTFKGGIEALKVIISALPADVPALLDMLKQPPVPASADPVATLMQQEEHFATDPSQGTDELSHIDSPSTYTCPECYGTPWQLHHDKPLRFRCPTGHSYTARVLAEAQPQAAEDALWGAIRARQKKEKLFRQLADSALGGNGSSNARNVSDYQAPAERARTQAGTLRQLIAGGQPSPL